MKLTEEEQELIEAMRNYRASRGRMDHPEEQEWFIKQLFDNLMGW